MSRRPRLKPLIWPFLGRASAKGSAILRLDFPILTTETACLYLPEVESAIQWIGTRSAPHLMLDLLALKRLDTFGTQLVMAFWYAGVQASSEVCILVPPGPVESLLQDQGLHRIARLYESEAEAVKYAFRYGWVD